MHPNNTNFEIYLKTVLNDHALEHEIPKILDCFQLLALKKNECLAQSGVVCKHFCYIECGILMHSIDILGEEKTTYLALKDSVTSALNSFKNKVPSRKSIKALIDCTLWVIDVETFNDLLKNNTAFYRFYYNLIENQIFRIDDYRIDLLTLTPEERYKKLLRNENELLQDVPLHYLASFLGISSRHMSRIRKNIK